MAEAHDLTKPLLNRNALSRPISYCFMPGTIIREVTLSSVLQITDYLRLHNC